MNENKNLHNGHRDRVKKRFESEGLEKFFDHQIIELLLFYGIPRKDTNEIAHRLMNRFGSLSAIFDAPVKSLQECGISYNTAIFLKLIPDVCSRYYKDKYVSPNKNKKFNSGKNIKDFVLTYFIGKNEEHLLLLLLNSKGEQLYCNFICKGTNSTSDVNITKILQSCVQHKASGAIIAYNHPRGIAIPSNRDIEMAFKLKKALSTIGVVLLEQFIVSGMEACAMSEVDGCEEIFF